jgi:carnitine O-acetyltransferase
MFRATMSISRRQQLQAGWSLSRTATSASPHAVSCFKPWHQPMIESDGDYRKEAFLETHIGGPLYANQSSLPRLPIPTLEETMRRFLPTALPLAKSEEEKSTLKEACQLFPQQAAALQQRLHHRRDVEMADSSWLQLWWNTWGYLQVRDSIVINVSYYFNFADDPTATTGVSRGASILFAAAEFRKRVCSGELPAEAVGKNKTPLCSVAFKYMFHACRIPKRVQDSYRIYDPSLYSHAVVARKGHFFAIPLCDPTTGDPVALEDLRASLERVVQIADASPPPLRLGVLTSNNRDDWADARMALLEAGGVAMEQALEKLESGAVMLCLDDEESVSRRQRGELFLYGGKNSGYNRWFDKSIQFICTNNGKAGLMGEHSMMDGMPVVALADHVSRTTYADASSRSAPAGSTGLQDIENIFGSVQSSLNASNVPALVHEAQNFHLEWTGKHDLFVQNFQGYGTNYIKQAGYSPDAYVQMAMQLATFRLWGEQGGTYEATQVRPFLHGRTETTRSVSPQSEAFVKRMGLLPNFDEKDSNVREEKVALLRDAVDAHVRYIGDAAKGMGVDRHLTGLSMLVQDGEMAPSLYSHPLFARAKTWRVSTSNLSHPKFENWGYGEVTPTGVGLSYSIHPNHCTFSVTSLKETGYSEPLCHYLEEELLEMQCLVATEQPLMSRL